MIKVEDGTGFNDANSYASVAFADDYFAVRGLDQLQLAESDGLPTDMLLWRGDEYQKAGALIRATDHIEAVFGYRFSSEKLLQTQALSFPRVGWEGVPLRVKKSCCEYALRALQGELITHPNPKYTESVQGKVIRKKEKIGPIEEETVYSGEGATIQTEVYTPQSYPQADLYLTPYLKIIGNSGGLVWAHYVRN